MSPHSLKQEEDKQLVRNPPHSEAADHNYDYVCDLVQRAQETPVTLQYIIMYVGEQGGQDLEGFATDSFMGGRLGVDAAVCRLT